jgi:hypothetical protein
VPQRRINAYNKDEKGDTFKDGDLVVRFVDCTKMGPKACETEAQPYIQRLQSSLKNS